MRKVLWLYVIVLCLTACNNSGITESRADSLVQKLDTKLEKVGDSLEAKGERTLEKIKVKVGDLGDKSDSAITDSVR